MADTDTPSREEVAAKLESVEARVDSKLVLIDSKLDRLFDFVKDHMAASIQASERAEKAANEAKQSASSIKWHILFTAIGILGVLYATWAIWSQGMELVVGLLGAGGAK